MTLNLVMSIDKLYIDYYQLAYNLSYLNLQCSFAYIYYGFCKIDLELRKYIWMGETDILSVLCELFSFFAER